MGLLASVGDVLGQIDTACCGSCNIAVASPWGWARTTKIPSHEWHIPISDNVGGARYALTTNPIPGIMAYPWARVSVYGEAVMNLCYQVQR